MALNVDLAALSAGTAPSGCGTSRRDTPSGTEPAAGGGSRSQTPSRTEPAPLAALRILADAVAAGHRDPFDPAVPLVLAAGPLAGSGAPGTARVAAIGLSPLSGAVGETRAEGPFGAALRAAGAATLVLTGRAARPSILVLSNGSAALCDAAELADAGTVAATETLRSRYGDRAGIAVIGPAGMRRARAATILTDRYFPLPRLGFGAILGDRNLTAIVCLDGVPPPVADPAALAAVAARYRAEQPDNPLTAWQHRPPGFGVWPYDAEPGYGARRNFADTATTVGDGLAPDRFLDRYRAAAPCPDCPTDCLKVLAPPAGPPVALHQEAVAALGPNLGIDDADTVLAAVAACLDAGLDPVSVGGTLACLYEAAQRGRIPAGWPCCGFGTDPAPLIAAAAHGDDEFAAALRGGAAGLAARLGVPDAAMTVRGVELPPFDPRIQPGLALAYAAAPTGPRYDAVEHDLDFDPDHGAPHCWPQLRELGLTAPEPAQRLDADRADRTAVLLALWSALDAYGICPYASTPTRPLSLALVGELIAAGTGYRPDTAALLELGAERLRRQHRINAALGVAEPDRLPYRMHTEPVAAGAHAGAVLHPDLFTAALARLRTRLGLS